MIDNGIISHIASHLVYDADKQNVMSEVAWLTTYLAARFDVSRHYTVCTVFVLLWDNR